MREEKDIRDEAVLGIATEREKKGAAFWRRIGIFGSLLMIAFLLGFLPVWLNGRETARQRDAAQTNLRLSRLQNRLATAAINARRGEYEPARLAASDFYTDLRAEIDRRDQSAFSSGQLETVQPMLDGRDEIITLLARNDVAAAERLSALYLAYAQVANSSAPKELR